mmetsp:Transcript_58929/g.117088  ORF Transcript_58929/g.117088 Transcript_58929/m.117088 type:complete len:229 (-) Transcript_58929:391-1077(-)
MSLALLALRPDHAPVGCGLVDVALLQLVCALKVGGGLALANTQSEARGRRGLRFHCLGHLILRRLAYLQSGHRTPSFAVKRQPWLSTHRRQCTDVVAQPHNPVLCAQRHLPLRHPAAIRPSGKIEHRVSHIAPARRVVYVAIYRFLLFIQLLPTCVQPQVADRQRAQPARVTPLKREQRRFCRSLGPRHFNLIRLGGAASETPRLLPVARRGIEVLPGLLARRARIHA